MLVLCCQYRKVSWSRRVCLVEYVQSLTVNVKLVSVNVDRSSTTEITPVVRILYTLCESVLISLVLADRTAARRVGHGSGLSSGPIGSSTVVLVIILNLIQPEMAPFDPPSPKTPP